MGTVDCVRWTLLACVVLVAACDQIQPADHPTALPGTVPAGIPESSVVIAGEDWDVCTGKQLKQYPPVLDKPATTYYAGPWCRAEGGGTAFLWVYAQPLFDGEEPQEIRGYVNEDASLLVRGLRTTGYAMVSSSPRYTDVQYIARRPTSPNVVSIQVLGENPPPVNEPYTGDDPLRLEVAVRKAGPTDTPAPTP
jgi:hypothetical protein